MPDRLVFADAASASDALTFAQRAVSLTETGVRFQAAQGVVAITAAPLAPRGLFDSTPTILVMRTARVDPELVCDIVVEGSSLTVDENDPRALTLPEMGLSPAWAGISPPRSGWARVGSIDAVTLAARARWGVAAVAEGVPRDSGEDAVRAVRASVWGAPDASLGDQPLGVAFAAFVMGLIGGEEEAGVLASGTWRRTSLARGHVVVRGPARMGLTEVRESGRL